MEKFTERMEKDNVSSSKPESNEKKRMPPGLLRTIAKHADWTDIVLMALGTAGCIANGLSMSLIMLVLSRMTNSYASMASITPADINQVSSALEDIIASNHVCCL